MKKGILVLLLCFIVVVSGCSSTTSSSENDLPKEIRLGYQASPNGELLAKARQCHWKRNIQILKLID